MYTEKTFASELENDRIKLLDFLLNELDLVEEVGATATAEVSSNRIKIYHFARLNVALWDQRWTTTSIYPHHTSTLIFTPMALHKDILAALASICDRVHYLHTNEPMLLEFDLEHMFLSLDFGTSATTTPCVEYPFAAPAVIYNFYRVPEGQRAVYINHPDNRVEFSAHTPLWRVREAMRCGKGAQFPPAVRDAIPDDMYYHYLPRPAEKDSNIGKIAFTESIRGGIFDRQAAIKPGRFMRMVNDTLTDQQIKDISAIIAADSAVYTLHFTADEHECAEIYMAGPSSCMSYRPSHWNSMRVGGNPYHPTRVYMREGNNIALAWIVDDHGEVLARTLVNTARMQYVRIYAKENPHGLVTEMRDMLRREGYSYNELCLDDERIQQVSLDGYHGSIVCPFIDPGNQGVTIAGGYLIIGGNQSADHSTGCLSNFGPEDEDTWCCEECDGTIRECDDNGTYIEHNERTVCQHCLDHHYVYARIINRNSRFTSGYVHESEDYLYGTENMTSLLRNSYNGVYDPYSTLYQLCGYIYCNECCVTDRDDIIEIVDSDGDGTGDYMLPEDMDKHDYYLLDGCAIHEDDLVEVDGERMAVGQMPDLSTLRVAEYIGPIKAYETIEEGQVA